MPRASGPVSSACRTGTLPLGRRLTLTPNMRFHDVRDSRGLSADIADLGLWGNGDVQVQLDKERQIPYAMELI